MIIVGQTGAVCREERAGDLKIVWNTTTHISKPPRSLFYFLGTFCTLIAFLYAFSPFYFFRPFLRNLFLYLFLRKPLTTHPNLQVSRY